MLSPSLDSWSANGMLTDWHLAIDQHVCEVRRRCTLVQRRRTVRAAAATIQCMCTYRLSTYYRWQLGRVITCTMTNSYCRLRLRRWRCRSTLSRCACHVDHAAALPAPHRCLPACLCVCAIACIVLVLLCSHVYFRSYRLCLFLFMHVCSVYRLGHVGSSGRCSRVA